MKSITTLLLFALLSAVVSFGQTKNTKKTSTTLVNTRVWHRHVRKDEIDGDILMYYLRSVEDENVRLMVFCEDGGGASSGSLTFPFTLYGITNSTLEFKSATGYVGRYDMGLTDTSDQFVSLRADVFKSLVGGAFRVEDALGNFHTYHLPSVGTAPFDAGCK
jgi:hypothetical protein